MQPERNARRRQRLLNPVLRCSRNELGNDEHVLVAPICPLRNRLYENDNKCVALMKHRLDAETRDLEYRKRVTPRYLG